MKMYKIMIVEDDKNMCFLYSKMKDWNECGFRVVQITYNGKEALKHLEKNRYDVVLTDIRMPDMDGITLLKEIKKREISVLTVLISSHDEFEYARQGILLGAFDFLVKPIRKENLRDMLLRLKQELDQKRRDHIDSGFMKVVIEQLKLNIEDDFVVKTCRICIDTIEEDITMEACAQEMKLSKDYFGKLVKQHFNMPFKEVINTIKMEYAKKLIQEENMKNYEISQLLGYSTPDYFTKKFKQYTGTTPSKYRKE